MPDQPLCNCHGCRFEQPKLEARIVELERVLEAHRAEYVRAYILEGWDHGSGAPSDAEAREHLEEFEALDG